MPATKKTQLRVTATARAEEDARRLAHIVAPLEAAQKDLAALCGSLGTGVGDLRRDVSKLLRDARRDLRKMRRAVLRDVERLQRDLTAPAPAPPPAPSRARTPASRPASHRPVGTAH